MNVSDRLATEIAIQLGIRRNQPLQMERTGKNGHVASATKGRPKKEDQSETAQLKQLNKLLKEEDEILKKPP